MTPYYYYKGEYQPDCWLHHKMATSPPQPFSLCNRRKETMIVFDRRGDRSLLNAFPLLGGGAVLRMAHALHGVTV